MTRPRFVHAPLLLSSALAACAGEPDGRGSGALSVILETEDTIVFGLSAGSGPENVRDGWDVSFDKYVVGVGPIELKLATDETVARVAGETFLVDLTRVASSGLPLWELQDLSPGRWEFGYSVRGAGADSASRHDSVSEADFAEMRDNDLSYLIEGRLTRGDGRSCPPVGLAAPPPDAAPVDSDSAGNPCYERASVGFRFGASVETRYAECEVDGVVGVSIPDGARATVAATIHGDHPFFNGFPEGGEGGVRRLAQWMADSDLNLDGELVQSELEALSLSDLAVIDERYQLGGAQASIDDAWDYLREQLATQGHYQGEGECLPTRLD